MAVETQEPTKQAVKTRVQSIVKYAMAVIGGFAIATTLLVNVATLRAFFLPNATSPVSSTCLSSVFDNFATPLGSAWVPWSAYPRSSSSASTQAGHLYISAPAGSDLFPTNNFNAPRVLRCLHSASYVVDTQVAVSPKANYQGAGILIWQDSNNFIRLERSFGGDASTANGIRLDIDDNGVYRAVSPADSNPTGSSLIALRIERQGDHFIAWWSDIATGSPWEEVGDLYKHIDPHLQQVGLDLVNNPRTPLANPNFEARFDFFSIALG